MNLLFNHTTNETRYGNIACCFCTISGCLVDAGCCWLADLIHGINCTSPSKHTDLFGSCRISDDRPVRSADPETLEKTRKVAEEVGVFTEETTAHKPTCWSLPGCTELTTRGIQSEVEEDKTGSLTTCKHGEPRLLNRSMQSLWIS